MSIIGLPEKQYPLPGKKQSVLPGKVIAGHDQTYGKIGIIPRSLLGWFDDRIDETIHLRPFRTQRTAASVPETPKTEYMNRLSYEAPVGVYPIRDADFTLRAYPMLEAA